MAIYLLDIGLRGESFSDGSRKCGNKCFGTCGGGLLVVVVIFCGVLS